MRVVWIGMKCVDTSSLVGVGMVSGMKDYLTRGTIYVAPKLLFFAGSFGS
jgi:hypothetical protein